GGDARLEGDAGQPGVGAVPGVGGREGDAGEIGEGLPVAGLDGAPAGDPLVERGQLAPAEGGQEVGQAVVVADLGVLVVGGRLPGLGGEVAGPVGGPAVVAQEGAARRRGDDLVAVERQDAGGSERAGRPAAEGGPERLGRVLDDGDAVFGADGEDGVVIGAGAVEVHGDHGG